MKVREMGTLLDLWTFPLGTARGHTALNMAVEHGSGRRESSVGRVDVRTAIWLVTGLVYQLKPFGQWKWEKWVLCWICELSPSALQEGTPHWTWRLNMAQAEGNHLLECPHSYMVCNRPCISCNLQETLAGLKAEQSNRCHVDQNGDCICIWCVSKLVISEGNWSSMGNWMWFSGMFTFLQRSQNFIT